MNSAMRRCGHRQALALSRVFNTASRQYTTNTPRPTDGQKVRISILDHALTKVNQLGWTPAAIEQAATDLGYSPMALASRDGMPLIDHFMDRALDETCIEADDQLHEFDTPIDRIRFLCRVRLRQTRPYIRRWPEAAALLAQPGNVRVAMGQLSTLVSRMWYLAGDQSTQIDWHAKRSMLAAAYVASELYMCEDTSADFSATWQFLDRRIENMQGIEHTANMAQNFGNQFSRNLFNILASRGYISQ
ncbi:Ubiquinone biosynthesis protein coq9, mitochondrial [Coemansia sp. RSA 678]|nr:Ubiquinone biosynthesis protein coq9, mitochondrial [Coemansia sp. RSA 678]